MERPLFVRPKHENERLFHESPKTIFVIGEAEVYNQSMGYLKSDAGLADVGCHVNPGKSITIVPHTANAYTGTDADYADIPEGDRPRPKNPAKPDGAQIGRLWNAATRAFVPGVDFGGCPIGSDEFITLWLDMPGL